MPYLEVFLYAQPHYFPTHLGNSGLHLAMATNHLGYQ